MYKLDIYAVPHTSYSSNNFCKMQARELNIQMRTVAYASEHSLTFIMNKTLIC